MYLRPLTAAALVLAAPFASAQSSLTLYGIADAWVGKTSTKVGATATTARGWVAESAGGTASRWGLRGVEDLGNGLSARFVLEQGFLIDNGEIASVSGSTSGFNRAAWVGLAGAFGETRFGRMLGAYDAFRGSNNHVYDSGFAATGQVWAAGASAGGGLAAVAGSDYLARGNNTIYYKTPQWGPFVASVSLSLDENQATATSGQRVASGHVEYVSGPLRVGVAVQDDRFATGRNQYRMVAGHYNFGVARVVANFQRQDDERVATGQKSDEYQIGVDVPMGAAKFAIGYAHATTRNDADRTLVTARGLGLLAGYDLSKRTALYVGARKVLVERGNGSKSLVQTRQGVGITHRF